MHADVRHWFKGRLCQKGNFGAATNATAVEDVPCLTRLCLIAPLSMKHGAVKHFRLRH